MKRVLLKLSGEALAGDKQTGFDEATCLAVADQVKQLVEQGMQIAVVTGGGNFWRGRQSPEMDRSMADSIGMLATVMNCIYVSDIFRRVGLKTSIYTPFQCGPFTKLYTHDAADASLENGLLAKNIDGVYDSDPSKNPDAKRYDEVSIDEVIEKNLQVIDMTASIMCRDNKLPLLIFALKEEQSIVRTASGEKTGTAVTV